MKCLTLPLLALLLSCAGRADVIYDSTAEGGTSGNVTGITAPLFDSFSTGASSEVLTGISLVLFSPPGPDPFDVSLYADNSTAPAVAPIVDLGTFSHVLAAGVGTYSVSLLSTPALTANTRYWIGLTPNSSTNTSWVFGFPGTVPTGAGVTGEFSALDNSLVGGEAGCTSLGGTDNGTNCVLANSPDNPPYEMQVATGVPEPASFGLLLSTLLLVGLFAAWRRWRPA